MAFSISSSIFLQKLRDMGISRVDAVELISYLTGSAYQDVAQDPNIWQVDDGDVAIVIEKLKREVPIPYITHRKEFYGYEFAVNADTLIPRADTETLVNAVLSDVKSTDSAHVVDLYTGSGCILLTLLKELPEAAGIGIDISPRALTLAQSNAGKLKLDSRASFIQYDILDGKFNLSKVLANVAHSASIITANPPYVSKEEYAKCDRAVHYEPKIALVADDEGFAHIKHLLELISKLKNSPTFYIEIGYMQANRVSELADSLGLTIDIIKDLAGNDRVLKVLS
ncbi:peptide chain release factor N(5)-glutamine methyltransferase [Deferribacterales bacterium RsTz2092]|nr:release factor glutamine methyltransferase [Deferribacterales bacterium]